MALVLRTGTRLKRVADVLSMHWNWCSLDVTAASYYSVRLWLLRLGLYQLSRPKVQADDWMWIMDHTMQLGERKCLIVVGIRQSAWKAQDRVLGHEDVELIDLVPVTESNGKVGAVGFCWGGGMVNRLAVAGTALAAGVAYYGTPLPASDVPAVSATRARTPPPPLSPLPPAGRTTAASGSGNGVWRRTATAPA